jgi:hypothetical protein
VSFNSENINYIVELFDLKFNSSNVILIRNSKIINIGMIRDLVSDSSFTNQILN